MSEVYIVDAKRSAVGIFGGSLADLPAHIIGAKLIEYLVSKSNIEPGLISQVVMGQVLTASQGQNPARQAAIYGGLPNTAPALTINQVCGSGLRAIAIAAQAIQTGDADVIIAGGQENMSSSHHSINIRSGAKFGDAALIDTMLKDGLSDAFSGAAMGVTAENIAKKYNISRQEQDEFACSSQNKAEIAQKNNKFADEILPLTIKRKKEDFVFVQDEFPRHGTTYDALAKLKPAFDKEGTVTAGNSSGINDGAAAVLIMSKTMVTKLGLKPMARIVSYATTGVDPNIMGTGPISAVRKALDRANWNIQDLDLIEANEAFAAQAISVNKELGWDLSKVNVNGGSIAIGHPIGASGARILVTLLHEMKKREAKKAIATLCIGGGMGIAMCVENL
jgi:acetyl-CoA C-acetyltransferase